MSGATLFGLAVGVAAGATAGLLAAPRSGAEIRANLRSRAAGGSARLQSLAASGRNWARETADHGRLIYDEGRRAYDDYRRRPAPASGGSLTATVGEVAAGHGGLEPDGRATS